MSVKNGCYLSTAPSGCILVKSSTGFILVISTTGPFSTVAVESSARLSKPLAMSSKVRPFVSGTLKKVKMKKITRKTMKMMKTYSRQYFCTEDRERNNRLENFKMAIFRQHQKSQSMVIFLSHLYGKQGTADAYIFTHSVLAKTQRSDVDSMQTFFLRSLLLRLLLTRSNFTRILTPWNIQKQKLSHLAP